ncbi:MAG: DUF5916 domain-containing protein [Longimicrobiaceae bacterium]
MMLPDSSRLAAAAVVLSLLAGPAAAQRDTLIRTAPLSSDAARPAPGPVTARTAAGPIRLDGRLDEADWAAADSLDGFRQREPAEGAPASEATVVRVLRGADALYVGVRAYDRDAAAVRATQLRRDADLTVDDNVTLIIDSYHDRRGAFLFRTNPNGAMWDAQLTGFEDVNEDWNGIWEVAAARDSAGWTAEFRIPWRTLRFRPGAAAIGFNVRRFIRRRNEETLWQSWGRTQGLTNLLYAGEIAGVAGVSRGRGVELSPYALARVLEPAHDAAGGRLAGAAADAKAGLDAKVAVSPTLTADLTVNTDFAPVEADQQVINLTRFPVFFPEKRTFFLESSGLFDFGSSGRAQLFYSRRIGLREGRPVPIVAGARAYGKIGPWAVGVLDARTGGSDQANDAVVRVRHDLFARSSVGAIATLRSGPGVDGAERAAGFDVQLPLVVGGRNVEPSFWIAATRTPAQPGTPLAWRVATDYPNDLFDNFVSLYRVDPGFSPALGFVRRTGIWESTGHFDFMPRPGVLGVRQLDLKPIPSWDVIADHDGSLLRSRDWQTAEFEWRLLGGDLQSGGRFEINVQRLMDAPRESFELFRDVAVAPGRYWWTRGELQYGTSPGRPLSVEAATSWGGFYGGADREVSLAGTWRGGGHLIVAGELTRSAVRLPAGRFTAVQASGRVEYAFNTRTDLLAFVQHNNEDQRVDLNLRFHWTPRIGDDVYVVWNSGYTTDPDSDVRFPRFRGLGRPLNGALVVKAVRRFAPRWAGG